MSDSESGGQRKARRSRQIAVVLALCTLGGIGGVLYQRLLPNIPRIRDSKRLTFTAKQKTPAYPCYLGTDGTRIYFQEHRLRDRWTLSEVSTQGGAQSDIAAPSMALPCPQGVSPSGSEMLVKDCCPFKLWSLPLPTGSARPVPYEGVIWTAWTPDGQSFVYVTFDGKYWHLYRGTIDGKTKQHLASAPDIGWPRVSPDGKVVRYTVALGAEGAPTDIWEADLDGRNPPRLVFPEMKGETWFGDWTADGKLFFFHRRKGTSRGLWVVRENNDPLKFFRPHPTLLYAGPLELRSPVSSKNSKELYAIGLDLRGELSVLDPATSKFVPLVDGVSGCFVTFSPDRQWVAYVSYPDGALWKSRVDGSEKMQLTFSPTGVINPRWSPDGKFIVFMDWYSGPNHVIYLISADGEGRPQLLATAQDQPADPTWMPDSNSIVYSGPSGTPTKIHMLDLSTMRSRDIPASDGFWSPRVSPNGKHIVALSNKGADKDALVLYSFSTKLWKPLDVGKGFGFPAWSHDSKYVYAYRNSEGKFSRVNINSGKLEVVANLDNVAWTAFRFRFSGWFDLTPDDRIMIMRDTGAEDIYSLQLEY